MKNVIRWSLLIVVGLTATVAYLKSYHPLRWILMINQVQYHLGFSQTNYLELFGSKKGSNESIPWFDSRFEEVSFSGYCDNTECWNLKAHMLEFRDTKFGIAYSPLLRQGFLSHPTLTISIPGYDQIHCHALEGQLEPEDNSVVLKTGLACSDSENDLFISKVELHPKRKFATIHFWSRQENWKWQ